MKQRVIVGMDHRLSVETFRMVEAALCERNPEIDWILIAGATFATDIESEAWYLSTATLGGSS